MAPVAAPAADNETLHPCARCAQMQKTCCQRADILVTLGDIARIEHHTNQHGFWSWRTPGDPAYTDHDPDDPNWREYTLNEAGQRRLLNRRPNGDCSFLGEHGCSLPTEVRPIVCRLYPLTYNERGLDGVDSEYCPTKVLIPKDQPGVTMLNVLDMKEVDGERWRRMLYTELRQEKGSLCESA